MKKAFLMLLVCVGLQFAKVQAAEQKVAENTVASVLTQGVDEAIDELQKDWNQCSICLENMDPDDEHALECGHKIHKNCMSGWAQAQRERNQLVTCPLCRAHSPSTQVEVGAPIPPMTQFIDLNIERPAGRIDINEEYLDLRQVARLTQRALERARAQRRATREQRVQQQRQQQLENAAMQYLADEFVRSLQSQEQEEVIVPVDLDVLNQE